jgi:tRNA(Ile)-lysidine synthase
MLLRTVRATIEKYGMFKRGDRVVVAVSGGPDSVALLRVLDSLKGIYEIHLHAAHLEHGIRADESLEDMKFVQAMCEEMAVPLSTGRASVRNAAETGGLSLEAAARKARYAFLHEVSEQIGGTKIATGHNANDQAETLLLNILRGAGLMGLRGVRPALAGTVVRPLIESKRAEIVEYLEGKGLAYRTDSTNLDERYERNKIRQVLIPLIEKEFNPGIVDALTRTAGVFSIVDEYIETTVSSAMTTCCANEDGRTVVDLAAFGEIPKAIKLFTLYSVLRSYEQDDQVVSFDIISAVLNLAERSKSGSRVDIGSGIVVLKAYDKLIIGRDLAATQTYEVRLDIPGTTPVPEAGATFRIEVLKERPGTGEVFRGGAAAYFDFDEIELPLVARSWKEGDRFTPFGLSGTKKVHDIFIDEKVPISQRATIPIVWDREGIIWVAGVRRVDRARITDGTKTILKIAYEKGGE